MWKNALNTSASDRQASEPKEDVGITFYSYVCYDFIIKNNKSCAITFIDYTVAFDSISHKFMDATLVKASASRKSRAIFRAIYSTATGSTRIYLLRNVQNW